MTTELMAAIIASAVTLIGAVTTYIVNYLKTKSLKKRLQTLEDFFASDDTEYYVTCPNCNSKIILNKIKIFTSKQPN